MKPLKTDAVEMIPIRLMVSITIIAAITLMIGVSSGTLRIYLAEHQVEHECRQIQSTLATMMSSGVGRDVDDKEAAEGTKRVCSLLLPDSLLYLSFGGDPEKNNDGVLQPGLTEDGAAIFYKVEGGSKQVIWLPKETYHFREGTFDKNTWMINDGGESYILRQGGTITLVFELIEKNHETFILIHGNDEITS